MTAYNKPTKMATFAVDAFGEANIELILLAFIIIAGLITLIFLSWEFMVVDKTTSKTGFLKLWVIILMGEFVIIIGSVQFLIN